MAERVRVRFAPSPTGFLHIGGARTALYNWLFARQKGGAFILRIEDTDRSRSTEEAIQAIVSSLHWLGLEWDEGPETGGDFGPYRQTERLSLYEETAQRLLAQKKTYCCYCTPDELKSRRRVALKEGRTPGYDGRCRELTARERDEFEKEGRRPAIRFACPREGTTVANDLIKGETRFENRLIDDFILLRADGFPTYNFAVVVDDNAMRISHVIRGEDHLPNTPKQILLYQALGFPIPDFAHLPMILGPDRKPLSKRHGATSVEEYRRNGYLPEAILNYLALLGWSYDEKTTLFTGEELIEKFSLGNVSRSPAIWDPAKLEWMNGHYIRQIPLKELTLRIVPFLREAGLIKDFPDAEELSWLERVVVSIRDRMKVLGDVVTLTDFLFGEVKLDPQAVEKVLKSDEALRVLALAEEKLASLPGFRKDGIERALRGMCEELSLKPAKALQPVRVAVTGKTVSPPLFESIELLGRERTLQRLKKARNLISDKIG